MSFAYITEDGAIISKRQSHYIISRNKEIILEIPEETLEGLLLVGTVQITSQAIVSLLHSGVPVTWLSSQGRFFGRLESTNHVRIFKQRRQFLLQKTSFSLELSRRIIEAKVHNQMTLLRRYNRDKQDGKVVMDITNIRAMRNHLKTAENTEQLMGYEGIIAKIYFSALGKIVNSEFSFEKRSKRPPKDEFNSMLSLGYTLVMYEIFTAISNEGLHPYVGFLHALKENHPALASDLLEEWRAVLVDSFVMSLIQHHEIKKEHFYRWEEQEGIFLSKEGRNIFFRAYEKKMRSINQYLEGKHSYRRTLNYQAAQFSQALLAGDASLYQPVWIR